MTALIVSVLEKESQRKSITPQVVILEKPLLFNEGPCTYTERCPTYQLLSRLSEKKDRKKEFGPALQILRERCNGECGGCLRYRQFKNNLGG